MRRAFHATLPLALCAALVSAASLGARAADTEPLPNPILVPGAPWAFDGFVVEAPRDADWASFSKTNRSAELGKKYGDGRTAAVVIDARRYEKGIQRAEDLLAIARRGESVAPDPAAMKLADYAQEAVAPKGVLCVRSAARFEDRRTQFSAPGTLFVRSLSCVRPDRPEILVSLRFAERYAADGPALGEIADALLASLRFVPPGAALLKQAREAVVNRRGEEAVAPLSAAARDGDAEAAVFLGNMYLYGQGVPEDLEQARKWLELAARQGRGDALYNLGAIYDKGLGVARDTREAVKWFTLAADQRDAQAQLNLALLHLHGDGVEKNLRAAEEWLRRAAGNGNKRARGILQRGIPKP